MLAAHMTSYNHALENDMQECVTGKNIKSAYEPDGPSGWHLSPLYGMKQ